MDRTAASIFCCRRLLRCCFLHGSAAPWRRRQDRSEDIRRRKTNPAISVPQGWRSQAERPESVAIHAYALSCRNITGSAACAFDQRLGGRKGGLRVAGRNGLCRRRRHRLGGLGRTARRRDLRDALQDSIASGELLSDINRKPFGSAQPLPEILVAVAHCELEPRDRALCDFGRGDQFPNGLLELYFVGAKPFEPPIEDVAISDRDHEEDRDSRFDEQAELVVHVGSVILPERSPAVSNIAKVVLGLRSGLTTRTATRSPTRPMRPSVSATSPHRTVTNASESRSSASVSPTSSAIMRLSGNLAS